MKIKNILCSLAVSAAAMIGAIAPASATLLGSYSLNTNSLTSTTATGDYGTVSLFGTGASVTELIVMLSGSYTFAQTSGGTTKAPFAYSLSDPATVTFASFSNATGSTAGTGLTAVNQNPFGSFTNGETFAGQGSNTSYNKLTLDFTELNFADFVLSGPSTSPTHAGGYLFSSDVSLSGNTFTVATGPTVTVRTPNEFPIPEPTTLALLGLGLLGVAAARRRKN